MKVQGNKITITGATRGIGLAMLNKFYQLNNQIIAVARNQKALVELSDKYEGITTIQCDLSNENSKDELVKEIINCNSQDLL